MTRNTPPKEFLKALFDTAVAAALPDTCLAAHLPSKPAGRTFVVGAGKAAASMAVDIERHWDGPLQGIVVTRYGHGARCKRIEVIEAAHPVPDQAAHRAAQRIVDLVSSLGADDLLIVLISGGGSSLLSLPAAGILLDEKRTITKALLRSGATIAEINCVRKHLSAIKGGWLAARAYPAHIVTLAISDVPGDDISTIASGPTVPDQTTLADARQVLARYQIDVSEAVHARLIDQNNETPKAGNAIFSKASSHIIASGKSALTAAEQAVRAAGYNCLVLGDNIEGEAREIAKMHAAIAGFIVSDGKPVAAPAVILSGGETSVTVTGDGRGGRNSEFALSLAIALHGADNIHALACDTDGIDGSEDNAGAYVGPDTLAKLARAKLSPRALLENNDSYAAFQAIDDLIVTGPTRTNVNDFRAILIDAGSD